MADFEDSNSPTWANNLDGQVNLYDAVRRTISFESPEGKKYKLNDKIATLIVRSVRTLMLLTSPREPTDEEMVHAAPADGTSTSRTSRSTASPCRARCSTLASSSSTTPRSSSPAALARTSSAFDRSHLSFARD